MRRFGLLLTIGFISATSAHAQQRARTSMGGGLERRLSVEERAFLGRPLARVVKAINDTRVAQGQKPCLVSSPEGADPAKPETLVVARGHLTPWGAVPGKWDVTLDCGPAFLVRLSPEAYVPQEREKKEGAEDSKRKALVFQAGNRIVERGSDFVLEESTIFDSTTQTLYVGAIRPLPEEVPASPPALLAVPKHVEIFDSGGHAAMRKLFDVAAIAKALKSEEKPPPMPPRVQEKPAAAVDEAARRTDELAVYAALLKDRHAKGDVLVSATTARQDLPPETADVLAKAAPDLLPSVISDFAAMNREPQPFPAGALPDVPNVVRLPDEELKKFFGRHDKGWDGWQEFRKVHGDSAIYTFSRVGFSRDRSQAMVYVGAQADWLGGGGRIVILTRAADGWRELYEIPLWVS